MQANPDLDQPEDPKYFENNINMAFLSAQICVSETKAMKKKSPKGLVIALDEKGLNCEVN